jgi:hypothetical protein
MNLKLGDKVHVSGELTGFGDLEGYVTEINYKLISVVYTEESKHIANGYIGTVGKPAFFKKI